MGQTKNIIKMDLWYLCRHWNDLWLGLNVTCDDDGDDGDDYGHPLDGAHYLMVD